MRTGTIEMEPRVFNQDVYSNGGPAASVEMVHSEAARCRREAARMNDVAQPGPARPCWSGQLALEEQGSTAGGLCSVLDTRHCCSQVAPLLLFEVLCVKDMHKYLFVLSDLWWAGDHTTLEKLEWSEFICFADCVILFGSLRQNLVAQSSRKYYPMRKS